MLSTQAFAARRDAGAAVTPTRAARRRRPSCEVEINHLAALAGLMAEGMTETAVQRIIELQDDVAALHRRLAVQPIETTAH